MDADDQIKIAVTLTRQMFRDAGGIERALPGPTLAAAGLRALLEDIADRVFQLGITTDRAFQGTNIAGALEGDYIVLRPDLPADNANFVIAHELGHKALNHPTRLVRFDTDSHMNPNIAPDDLSSARMQSVLGLDLPRSGFLAVCGYNERDGYEIQANAFAVELLVPGDQIRTALESSPELRATEIAAMLGVPKSLALVGMKQALAIPVTDREPVNKSASDLDTDQRHAVHCATPALIVAGPGAGKTRVLTRRFVQRVAGGLQPREILALTFSNKAAAEMRERIVSELGQDRAGEIEVYTFHSFGLHLLQQYADRLGLPTPVRLITPMDALLLFRRRAAQMALGALNDLHKSMDVLKNMLRNIARSKEENAGPDRWQELAQEWAAAHSGEPLPVWATDQIVFYREYQSTLRRYGLLDYGDLQTETLRLFTIPEVAEEIRSRYREILVDETQDINYVSGLLIRALDGPSDRGRGVVWAVGDPRQSIYGFRGASPVNLSRFRQPEYYPDARVIALSNNYRSFPDIVTAGSSVPMPSFADPDLIPPGLNAVRTPDTISSNARYITSALFPHGTDELAWIAAEIARLCANGKRRSEIAILTRKNSQASDIAAALTAADIPHKWGGPLENRLIFKVLMSALYLAVDDPRGIVGLSSLSPGWGLPPDCPLSEADLRILFPEKRRNPGAREILDRAVRGEIPELSADGNLSCERLRTLADALSATYRPHQNLIVYLFEYARWMRQLYPVAAKKHHEVQTMLLTVLQTLDIAANFAAQRDSLARSVRSRTTAESKTNRNDETQAEKDEAGDPGLETSVTTDAFLDYIRAVISGDGIASTRELDIPDAVTILTAHQSKGLEWPIVFLPYSADLKSNQREDPIPLPVGIIQTDGETEEAIQQRDDACLFYVSITRARDALYFTSSERYKKVVKGGISALRQTVEAALREGERLHGLDAGSFTTEELSDNDDVVADSTETWIPYELQGTIPARNLITYKECPRKFQFSRIYGLRDSDWSYAQFHRVLFATLDPVHNDDSRDLLTRFAERWDTDGPPDAHWKTPLLRRNAQAVLARYIDPALDGQNARREFRTEVSVTLADANGLPCTVQFHVDELISLENGGARYRRIKTGARGPSSGKADQTDPLPLLYAMHAGEKGVPATVEYYFPLPDIRIDANATPRRQTNLRQSLGVILSDIRAGKMPPNPGTDCHRCDYFLICPAKH